MPRTAWRTKPRKRQTMWAENSRQPVGGFNCGHGCMVVWAATITLTRLCIDLHMATLDPRPLLTSGPAAGAGAAGPPPGQPVPSATHSAPQRPRQPPPAAERSRNGSCDSNARLSAAIEWIMSSWGVTNAGRKGPHRKNPRPWRGSPATAFDRGVGACAPGTPLLSAAGSSSSASLRQNAAGCTTVDRCSS